jgi:hypothetical protein
MPTGPANLCRMRRCAQVRFPPTGRSLSKVRRRPAVRRGASERPGMGRKALSAVASGDQRSGVRRHTAEDEAAADEAAEDEAAEDRETLEERKVRRPGSFRPTTALGRRSPSLLLPPGVSPFENPFPFDRTLTVGRPPPDDHHHGAVLLWAHTLHNGRRNPGHFGLQFGCSITCRPDLAEHDRPHVQDRPLTAPGPGGDGPPGTRSSAARAAREGEASGRRTHRKAPGENAQGGAAQPTSTRTV